MKYGLIAGGGSFPLMVLESARREGHQIVTVAIKEEASPEVEERSDHCHWISLGQLSKLIDIFHEGRHHGGSDGGTCPAQANFFGNSAGTGGW